MRCHIELYLLVLRGFGGVLHGCNFLFGFGLLETLWCCWWFCLTTMHF